MSNEVFWKEKWEKKSIGFHLDNPHKCLVEFIDLFSNHKKVLVPLCGKSKDMIFLRQAGLEIIGVEFSELAVQDFIKENNLEMEKISLDDFNLYQCKGFKIYQGDLFKLPKKYLDNITCCYDRASMVALDIDERIKYSQFLINLASDVNLIFTQLLDYGDIGNAGPPFSVVETELTKLYGEKFNLEELKSCEVPLRDTLKSKGAISEKEITWLLTRKEN